MRHGLYKSRTENPVVVREILADLSYGDGHDGVRRHGEDYSGHRKTGRFRHEPGDNDGCFAKPGSKVQSFEKRPV